MEEINNKINETVAKIAVAEGEGDFARRNTLETLLVELHRNKNLLLQQAQQKIPGIRLFSITICLYESLHDVVDMSICRYSPAGLFLFIMIYYHYFAFVLNF